MRIYVTSIVNKSRSYTSFLHPSSSNHNRGSFARRTVVKDSLNKEFYDIANAVYYGMYKEYFDEVVVK